MSFLATGLKKGCYYRAWAWCPSCGNIVDIDDLDDHYCQTLESGDKEYNVTCPECYENFYVSEFYN